MTIARKRGTEPALDQQQLYAIGLAHVQRLSRRVWSDYNLHDPGVTILELLCYGLTDLAYRTSLPIADLLTAPGDNGAEGEARLVTARRILPNRPLTELDYRKLLIDLPGVRNAWLAPVGPTYYADTVTGQLLRTDPGGTGIEPVRPAGLYEVLIDYDSTRPADQTRVEQEARRVMQANRNLCEDFVAFRRVETQSFILCGELELHAAADQARVQAELLHAVQQYLAPPVPTHTLAEMEQRRRQDGSPLTVEDIFDGPALDNGFIDDAELAGAALRTDIRLSDLIGLIMAIDGVAAVRELVIQAEGEGPAANPWVVPVALGKKAVLNMAASRLVLYKRTLPVTADAARVRDHLRTLAEAAANRFDPAAANDYPVPRGRFRHPQAYLSIQHHFPAIYGLGETGPSESASAERAAEVLQLKGYLLFFDQLMADYLAQLAHVGDLFSLDPTMRRATFRQAVTSIVDHAKLYGVADVDDIESLLTTAVEEEADREAHLERRNRFLDHLIARFAERFTEFAHLMHAEFGADGEEMIAHKCAFLQNYPETSSGRALAWNQSLRDESDLWNSANISGLERRLAGLLGIANPLRRNLGDIAFDIYVEVDDTEGDEFRFRIRSRQTGKIILSSSTRYATAELAWAELRVAIRCGQQPEGYQRRLTRDGRHYFNVIDPTGEVVARRIEYFVDPERMEAAIDATIDYLRVNYSEEGMYVIENILLLPEEATDPFLPICPAGDRRACADIDPYSYRLHIILPAYGSRFHSMAFRRFAEEVIREETPAHILPKICWADRETMARFEGAYRDWLFLRAGRERSRRRDRLTRFITELTTLRNVYPAQRLHDCTAQEQELFILGQSGLGTEENNQQ